MGLFSSFTSRVPAARLHVGFRRARIAGAATAAALLSLTTVVVLGSSASAADTPVRDGSRYDRAAASCWEVKQVNPSAPSGVYWLQTPALVAPQQFFCDQVTDGGGWVLVGRGREGWSFATTGQGSPTSIRTAPFGPAAFSPAALSTATIDGLLNNTAVSDLPDGIRVWRAATSDGAIVQELRLHTAALPAGVPAGWSWAFNGGIKLASFSDNGILNTSPGLHSRNLNAKPTGGDGWTQLSTYEWKNHNYRNGFWYGYEVVGNQDPNSFLWQYGTERNAVPFAQVWLRPRLTQADVHYPAPDPSGAGAQTLRPLMRTTTEPGTTWGVSGIVGGGKGENNLEVQALATIGTTLYVGGKFEYVQRGATPGVNEKVRQPYLAAFDIPTGAWKPAFLPVLDGQVRDIIAAPDGSLFIAGEFTIVNGVSNTQGLAKIDATTGEVVPGWSATLYDSTTPANARGRALDIHGQWLYVGGTFNTVYGGGLAPGTTARSVKLRNMTRVNLATGEPDPVWRPTFNAGVVDVDVSARGDRVYIAGFFKPDATTSSYTQASGMAVVSTSGTGALVPGWKQYQPSTPNKQYQQTVVEVGDTYWKGGSEHVWQQYNRDTFDLLKSNITQVGGDFQESVVINGVVYAACHCADTNFSDATIWNGSMPVPSYSRPDPIAWIGAWDATTGEYLPEFAISGLRMREGDGPWALTSDEQGCLWFGGDVRQGSWSAATGGYQWLGGFGRVCPRDTTAPDTPGGLSATRTSTGVNLSWGASADHSSAVQYELLRNDRVILVTSSTRYTDVGAPDGATYWVRAVDAAGNRSATTVGVAA